MVMTAERANKLAQRVVGSLRLIEIDSTVGFLRLVEGNDGAFTDVNGVVWHGLKLISTGDVATSVGGSAPAIELSLSYENNLALDEIVGAVRSLGVAAIRGRTCKLYFQYIGKYEDRFAPVDEPQLFTTREMLNLTYDFQGAQQRRLTLLTDGPFALRSRPVNGLYTDADQRRRTGTDDPSLEFMPNNSNDEQALFGAA